MSLRRSNTIVPSFVLALVAPHAAAQYAVTTRVDLAPGGVEANFGAHGGRLSRDGRYVAFASSSTNLTATPQSSTQVYLVDRSALGQNELLSVSNGGTAANGSCYAWSISADGRYVAYNSMASNLVPFDTNAESDCFVRDRQLGTTTRVSVSPFGVQGNDLSGQPFVSDDGARVAFVSFANNLVTGDTNARGDVFLKDLTNGAVTRLSMAPGGVQSNGDALYMSADASVRWVCYMNSASNLVAGDTNAASDVFVSDAQTATTVRVNVATGGAQANAASDRPVISRDGRVVAFSSLATNLVPGDTNAREDVFTHDLASGVTERASVKPGELQIPMGAQYPQLSGDGRFVAFMSWDATVLPGDDNDSGDVFVFDRVARTTSCASLGTNGEFVAAGGNTWMHFPISLSGDGRYVGFESMGASLVPNDVNHQPDVFVRDWLASTGPVAYCTAATTSGGCVPQISASANPSATFATPCALSLANLDAQRSGILFYGVSNTALIGYPWIGGPGFLCVRSPHQRTPIQNSGGTAGQCDGSLVLDWNAFQQSHPTALGNPWQLGGHAYVQGWFRDSGVGVTALSNALELTAQP